MAASLKLLYDQACFHVRRLQVTLKYGLQNNTAMKLATAHLKLFISFSLSDLVSN